MPHHTIHALVHRRRARAARSAWLEIHAERIAMADAYRRRLARLRVAAPDTLRTRIERELHPLLESARL